MKTLISKKINLELFCKNPLFYLEKTENGAILVLKNKNPIFYAITANFLKKILHAQYNLTYSNKKTSHQKFLMYSEWTPDNNFIHQCALWGIILNEEVKPCELKYFISYWKAEGCFFHHIQWQQKLARSLQKSRSMRFFQKNVRDITDIPKPDKKTPNGFRGE